MANCLTENLPNSPPQASARSNWNTLPTIGTCPGESLSYDRALLLVHHSILSTDEDPLINSKRVTDFVLAQKIEAVFCGHTHELDILQVSDLITGGRFRQFMCGSLSSVNIPRDKNMFCTYENFGSADEIITVTRMIPTDDGLEFIETVLGV